MHRLIGSREHFKDKPDKGGDMGDYIFRTISQKFPVARKLHKCFYCGREIIIGETYGIHTYTDGEKIYIEKYCYECW